MTKGQAVELMGSPVAATRKNSIDYWYYYLNPGERLNKRVLHFEEGRLIYRGPPVPPPLSAEQADLLKEKENESHLGPQEPQKFKRPYTDKELRQLLKKEVRENDPHWN